MTMPMTAIVRMPMIAAMLEHKYSNEVYEESQDRNWK